MTDIKPVTTDLPSPAPDNPLEALSWLGDTVEEIADGLRERGIKGRRWIADQCPLANYLHVWYKDASVWTDVSVCDDDSRYYFHERTPEPAYQFAKAFDQGCFPDLVEWDEG